MEEWSMEGLKYVNCFFFWLVWLSHCFHFSGEMVEFRSFNQVWTFQALLLLVKRMHNFLEENLKTNLDVQDELVDFRQYREMPRKIELRLFWGFKQILSF
jgi:hypothetical protein